jgi:hypothetical protein
VYRKIHADRYHKWMRRRWERQAEEIRRKREKSPKKPKKGDDDDRG